MEAINKLYILVQQIEMTEDQYAIHFEQAELNRVNIHRKSRVWQFNLTLEKPLPADVYREFTQTSERNFFSYSNGQL